ncbi:hypothetical protein OG711_38285 [Streptomyces uncialis]|uniref:hypothetical protein n=1 Tax=Streptomyces uncialis TaxID=1048205 RepID=UPI002E363614|nr:hypothetical protein [Streptomyces uncialis]
MIWTSEDVARDSVRRNGAGLTARGVDEAVAEAAVRERETEAERQAALRSPPRDLEQEPFAWDPEELAERWAAKHVEWHRVQALMESSGWTVYEPEKGAEGAAWARERETWRAGFLERQAAHQARRRDERDELRAEVRLTAPAGRRIQALAARAGVSPDQVVAQLAKHAVAGEDGTVSVPAFNPR